MTKMLFKTAFLAAAVLSAEACSSTATSSCLISVQSAISQGTSNTCDVVKDLRSCFESKLNGCPESVKAGVGSTMDTYLKMVPGYDKCQAESSPAPSPTPSSVPSPAASSCASFDM